MVIHFYNAESILEIIDGIVWESFFQDMRKGVIKDMERQESRKIMNMKQYQDQKDLDKILREQREEDTR